MSHALTGGRRPAVLAAAAVVAVALAFALAGSGTPGEAATAAPAGHAAGAAHSHAATPASAARTARAQALHDGMRKLWEDHITWTRLAIVSFAAGLPDFPQTSARLLRNQEDIGNAIKPYYGRRAGAALTTLLKEHITGAVALLQAAKAGDTAALQTARTAWYDNGKRIARSLNRANPRFWPLGTLRSLMRGHLDQTLDEAVARLQGHFEADMRAYERIHAHILMMADALSSGIVKQFPRRFR
jgi:hypothetical protein